MILVEHNFDTETLVEDTGAGKNLYIRGIFMQSEVVNRNRRIYPRSIMEAQVNSYVKNFVKTNQAVGELQHPSRQSVDLREASHLTESIVQDGNNFIGKAKILNTPTGQIVRGLLEGGVRLGVSSRGAGSVVTNKNGINEVQDDYRLSTIDIVGNPSAPDAFVDCLMESFVWNTLEEDTKFLEDLKAGIKQTKKADLSEAKMAAMAKFFDFLRSK